jgi:type IV pilus assembly protein PilC
MPQFKYRAVDTSGQVVTGSLEANHVTALAAQLSRIGLTLLRAKERKRKSYKVGQLSRRDVIMIFFHLEMLLRAGVPLVGALEDLRDSAPEASLRGLAGGLCERINSGDSLSQAMSTYPAIFSESTLNLIRSGEVSGELPEVLKELLISLKWADELSSKAKKVVAYPAFVAVVIIGVVMFLMIYLVPQMVAFIKNMKQELPFHTVALIATSNFVKVYWWALLLTPPLTFVVLREAAKRNINARRAIHKALLRIPFMGPMYQKITMARIADTLSLLYRSGIPLIEAIGHCQAASNNLAIQESIQRVQKRLSEGTGLADSFSIEPLFPPLVLRMLRVSESTGALDDALANVSYFYNRDINESISRLESLIEPVLTVILGLILGWIMLSVMGPIYDTMSKMKI